MPASLDRRELRRLIVVDIIAGKMSEEELDRDEHGCKEETHTQHDARFGVKFSAQRYQAPVAATQKAPVM